MFKFKKHIRHVTKHPRKLHGNEKAILLMFIVGKEGRRVNYVSFAQHNKIRIRNLNKNK